VRAPPNLPKVLQFGPKGFVGKSGDFSFCVPSVLSASRPEAAPLPNSTTVSIGLAIEWFLRSSTQSPGLQTIFEGVACKPLQDARYRKDYGTVDNALVLLHSMALCALPCEGYTESPRRTVLGIVAMDDRPRYEGPTLCLLDSTLDTEARMWAETALATSKVGPLPPGRQVCYDGGKTQLPAVFVQGINVYISRSSWNLPEDGGGGLRPVLVLSPEASPLEAQRLAHSLVDHELSMAALDRSAYDETTGLLPKWNKYREELKQQRSPGRDDITDLEFTAESNMYVLRGADLEPPKVMMERPSQPAKEVMEILVHVEDCDGEVIEEGLEIKRGGHYFPSTARRLSTEGTVSFRWDTRTVENGEYELTATAKDRKGNTGHSTTFKVRVENEGIPVLLVGDLPKSVAAGEEFDVPATVSPYGDYSAPEQRHVVLKWYPKGACVLAGGHSQDVAVNSLGEQRMQKWRIRCTTARVTAWPDLTFEVWGPDRLLYGTFRSVEVRTKTP